MRNERVFKNFSALSFDGKLVTGSSAPARGGSQPRLKPESVRDFNVHLDGSADTTLSQPERPGTTRHWPGRRILPVEFRQTRRRWRTLVILHDGSDPERTRKILNR
jgi:hypothetical protein